MLKARDMSKRHSSITRGRRGQSHQTITETQVLVSFNKSARDRRGNKDDIWKKQKKILKHWMRSMLSALKYKNSENQEGSKSK